MDPIRGSSAYNMPNISSANPAQATQAAAGAHPSGHADSLTSTMLSDHTVSALNAKETQGNENEKRLAGFAKQALSSSGQLQLSPKQPAHGDARFGIRRNQDVLVVIARLNENDQSKYDVLSVGFKRGSEPQVSMTLPSPSTAAVRTPRLPSALLSLPNELLMLIAGGTSNRGEGVNLSLRRVNKHMKAIADDQMSPRQSFLTGNGQMLHALGHSPSDMRHLAGLPEGIQDFVLTHGQTLQASGHSPSEMWHLAGLPEGIQDFVLTHGQMLHALGHSPSDMRHLAGLPEGIQNFVLTHGQMLHALGHRPSDMWHLARLPVGSRNFILTHGQTLHALGHDPMGMRHLAGLSEGIQGFVLTHGQTLYASGHDPSSMWHLAVLPESIQDFVLTHGQTLKASGHSPSDMRQLAGLSEGIQNFVLTHGQTLHALGHSPANMWQLAGLPENDRSAFLRFIGYSG